MFKFCITYSIWIFFTKVKLVALQNLTKLLIKVEELFIFSFKREECGLCYYRISVFLPNSLATVISLLYVLVSCLDLNRILRISFPFLTFAGFILLLNCYQVVS